VDMRLEVVVIPVADADRALGFCKALGWRLDADLATTPDFRYGSFLLLPGPGRERVVRPGDHHAAAGALT